MELSKLVIGFCHVELTASGMMRVINISADFAKIWDVSPDASVHLCDFSNKVHHEDRQSFDEFTDDVASLQETARWTGRVIGRAGIRYVRAEVQLQKLAGSNPYFIFIAVDINKERQIDIDLDYVLVAAKAYTWKRNIITSTSEFDKRWAEFSGYGTSAYAISTDEWLLAVHPDDRERIGQQVLSLERGDVESTILTYRRKVKDNQWAWLQVHAGISERDADDKPISLSGVSFDITDEMDKLNEIEEERNFFRKGAVEAKAQLERTAYELTEHIPIGTYTMVLDVGSDIARFSFMSNRFLEITGLDRDAAQANPMLAFKCVHPDDLDDWVHKNAEAFKARSRFREETRLLVNGEVKWIVAESLPRLLPDGVWLWEGVIQDITNQKLAEQALNLAQSKIFDASRLQAKLEERQELLRDLHDGFGNQLALAKIRLRNGSLSNEDAAGILQECIDDLRVTFDSLDADSDGLFLALTKLQDRTRHRVGTREIKFAWDIKAANDVSMDSRRVLQVLRIVQEAVGNALKHAFAKVIKVECTKSDEALIVEISDDGVGIPSPHPSSARGIRNMNDRARVQGWKFSIDTGNTGSCLKLRIPLEEN